MKLVFATNNKHKLEEIRKILPASVTIVSLKDIGCRDNLPEKGSSLQQNALQKAHYVFDKYGYACFADDSGLEVDALHGRPGVYSSRYASATNPSDAGNIKKLLGEMNEEENRDALFRTVIALIMKEPATAIYFFEGSVKGQIAKKPRGENGFGYDPVFIPEEHKVTFAEMDTEMKNKISHRAEAVRKLAAFLGAYKAK